MKRYLFKILMLPVIFSGSLFAQNVYSNTNNFSLSFTPTYENWNVKNGSGFSEISNILSANYVAAQNTFLSLVTRYASLSGDVDHLSGFSDSQISVTQKLPDYSLILNGGINIPSGKTKLTSNEFDASRIISQDIFTMKTPNFGQGLNLFLGGTYAYPLSAKAVIGGGISYQIKSEYQPLSDTSYKYQPSNEITLTGGLDYKLNEISTLTGDVTGIFYGSDKIDGKKIFSSGNRIVSRIMYRQYFGYNLLTAMLLYRNLALDKLEGNYAVVENEKYSPNQLYLGAFYNQRFNSRVRLEYGVFGSFYEKTSAYFSGYNIFGISISPVFRIAPKFSIPVYIKYAAGSASGKSDIQKYVIGAGINYNL
jgi:hypothetical protein